MKGIRRGLGLTRKEIAETCTITQQFYYFIETGERRPSPETAKKIAAALNFENHGFDWTKFFEDE